MKVPETIQQTMAENEIVELMRAHEVRPTANRIIIAEALAAAGRPLSLMELEDRIESIDKSGIFRSLVLFKEKHMLHTIEDGSNGVRYELCHSHSDEHDDDGHAHFFCTECHRTFCLNDVPTPDVALPDGFRKESVNIVIKGICPECSRSAGQKQ